MKKSTVAVLLGCSIALTASITSLNAQSSSSSSRVINQDDFTSAAESTVNGVVSVKSYATPRSQYSNYSSNVPDDFFSDPFFEFFFGPQNRQKQQPQQQEQPKEQEPKQMGLGSGVIISKDGYIVTNNHVIDGAERLEVTLNDNRNFVATVIGADPTTDLALIKIDAPDLHVIPMGDSEALKVGEWVLAVGNPFGFTSTVTSGIVSAKARNISAMTQTQSSGGIESYIQTDAAVNRGNSGGALVNLKGELVGINTAIYSQTGSYAGCSFAIPTSIVKKVVKDLKEYGTVQRAYLGIRFTELTPEFIKEKGIKGVNTGAYIASVEDRSAAKEAGLQEGDIITAINGNAITNGAQLQEQITKYRPGNNISITYIRDSKTRTANVTLRNNQGNTGITRKGSVAELGCEFAVPSEETLKKLNISYGVEVTEVNAGKFKEAGIQKGFVILDINNSRVKAAEDIEKIYNSIVKSADYDHVMFITGIYPSSGRKTYYAVSLSD